VRIPINRPTRSKGVTAASSGDISNSDKPLDGEPPRFGARLREARKNAGLTQKTLAKLAGITSKHVSELERCVTQPGLAVALALAKAMDITVTDFSAPDARTSARRRR